MAEALSEREQEIIKLVTEAMPEHFVTVKPISVHTLDGSESATLRFTADDTSSTDLKRDRIAGGDESPGSLATMVQKELLQQLGLLSR
jgi:hypothetical protein